MKITWIQWMAATLLMATVIGYTACNKPQATLQQATPALKQMASKYAFSSFPAVADGMLCFKDDDHYNAYLDFLQNCVDGIDPADEKADDHAVLENIEQGLSFVSLRKITHDAWERQNETGWPSLEAIPDEHFIMASDIRSTLNNNKEVKIGNEILHYVNALCAVKVSADRADLLAEYRKLPESVSFEDTWAVDPFREATTFILLTGQGGSFPKLKPLGLGPDVDFYYSVPDPCRAPAAVKFENMDYRFDGTSKVAYIKIDFGDGSPLAYKMSDQFHLTFYRVPAFSHTYPNVIPHTYTMTVTASDDGNFTGGTHTVTKTFPIVIGGFVGCGVGFKNSGWQYAAAGDNEYIGGKLDMEKYQRNSDKLRVVAYTKLVKETSPGIFQGFKGEVYSDLAGDAKRVDCSVAQHVSGSDWDSKTKFQTLHRTPDWNRYTEFVSHHIYTKKGQQYQVKIMMYPCD